MQKREGILLEETLKSWLIYVAKNNKCVNNKIRANSKINTFGYMYQEKRERNYST